MMDQSGTIIIDIQNNVVPVNGGKGFLFERGKLYDYNGVITLQMGCACDGSLRQVPHYVVQLDGKSYYVSSEFASNAAGIATEDTPDLIERVSTMGDGHWVDHQSGAEMQQKWEAQRRRFKLIM